MGYFENGTYSGIDNPYSEERQSARDRFSKALDQQSSADKNLMTAQAQQQNQQQYTQDKQALGSQAAKGALMGAGIGGPVGGAIGAGIGGFSGLNTAYGARRAHGEGGIEALLHSLTDVPDILGGAMGSVSAMPLAGVLGKQLMGGKTPAGPSPSAALAMQSDISHGAPSNDFHFGAQAPVDGGIDFSGVSDDDPLKGLLG